MSRGFREWHCKGVGSDRSFSFSIFCRFKHLHEDLEHPQGACCSAYELCLVGLLLKALYCKVDCKEASL